MSLDDVVCRPAQAAAPPCVRAALRDSQPPSLGRNTHLLWGGAKWEETESNARALAFIGLFRPSQRVQAEAKFKDQPYEPAKAEVEAISIAAGGDVEAIPAAEEAEETKAEKT